MKKCSFCENYEECKEIDELAIEKGFEKKYTAALVITSHRNGACKGRIVSFKKDGIGYELNYCPECGKKLSEGKQ